MSKRRSPLQEHPFMEEARLIRDLLREDRQVALSGSGRIVIAGDPDEYGPRLLAEARRLEHLALIDVNYPEEGV